MDTIEYETKVLQIDKEKTISILQKSGATEIPEYLEKRIIFDIESKDIEWVRVRQENEVCKMTYKFKELHNSEIGKTVEIETEVQDFDKTVLILSKLGFYYRTMYQEKYIHIFHLNDIEFSICTWPKLETYLEIEASNKEQVQEGLRLLGCEGKDVGDYDIAKLYTAIGIDMNKVSRLAFDS